MMSHFSCYRQSNGALLVLIPRYPGSCMLQDPVGLSDEFSPMRLGVSLSTTTPTDFYSWRFLRLFSPALEPWVVWFLSLPSCLSWFFCMQMWDRLVLQPLPCHESSPPLLPISTPPTGLDECFFFNSLIVGLLFSSIFWQFWLFFVFKFVVVLHLVV